MYGRFLKNKIQTQRAATEKEKKLFKTHLMIQLYHVKHKTHIDQKSHHHNKVFDAILPPRVLDRRLQED